MRLFSFVLAISIAGLVFSAALAANPDWPGGPLDDPRDALPDDENYHDQYGFFSYIPEESMPTINPEEIEAGAGMHIDRAWQITIGRPDVVIGMTDTGILWDEPDLIEKVALNAGELPFPEGFDTHDANNDDRVNVLDYADDPNVFDANENEVIDAGDLILIFSDDVDGDNNGYVDDIAGWDFLWNDNYPEDDTLAKHGTGVATWTVGKANDEWGHAGACPECMLVPLRVGDGFVGYINHFNEGALYAVDNGASVILHANSTINFSATTQAVLDYAWERNVVYTTILGDAASYHHVYPGAMPRVLPVSSCTHDEIDYEGSTSFQRLSNCSGFGDKAFVQAPFDCASTPTGIIAGTAGLIISRAREIGLDPPLSAAEVQQIFINTATDVNIPESAEDEDQYPSKPGWDMYFGYGRAHARDAVDSLSPTTIPPEAEITAPAWHVYIDPLRQSLIPISANIDARRAQSFSWELQAASGIEPAPEEFVTICSDEGVTQAISAAVCNLNVDVFDHRWDSPVYDALSFNVTILLKVVDNLGNEARDRRAFFVRHDPHVHANFPMHFDSSLEAAPQTTDIDGDGVYEIILATIGGMVDIIDANGVSKPGWPQYTDPDPIFNSDNPGNHLGATAFSGRQIEPWRQAIWGTPAVGDLDGDGGLDIVATTMEGFVFAWDVGGQRKAGFPVSVDPANAVAWTKEAPIEIGILAAPVIEDLEGDGDLEIIVGAMDRHVYVWHHDGTLDSGFPVKCENTHDKPPARIISTPAVGDMDGDGTLDIVVGTNEMIGKFGATYAIHGQGNNHPDGPFLEGWPVYSIGATQGILPFIGEGTVTSPSLIDLDGDDQLEATTLSGIGLPFVYDAAGKFQWAAWLPIFGNYSNATAGPGISGLSFVTWADVNLDGYPDLINSGNSMNYLSLLTIFGHRMHWEAYLYVMDGLTGLPLLHFPRAMEDLVVLYGPTVAQIDEDAWPEIIIGSGGYVLHAFDNLGDEPAGWPKFTGAWVSSPTAADITGDGYLEIITGSRDGVLFAWRTCGTADTPIESKGFHHDVQNTGNYHKVIPTQAGPTDLYREGPPTCGAEWHDGDDDTDDDIDDDDDDDNDDDDECGCGC
jgi:Subtilase family/FG-GAP-like repeat